MKTLQITIGILTLAISACSDPIASDRDLQLQFSIDRTVLQAGDTARIAVQATNRSSRALTIVTNECPGAFEVQWQDGSWEPPPRYCSLSLGFRELKPGETHVFRDGWIDAGSGGGSLSPGIFYLRARVSGPRVRATSASIEVRVLAP